MNLILEKKINKKEEIKLHTQDNSKYNINLNQNFKSISNKKKKSFYSDLISKTSMPNLKLYIMFLEELKTHTILI